VSFMEPLAVLSIGLPNLRGSKARLAFQTVHDGREAIATMRVLRFDLVLTNERISDMSVWTLVERIRMGWPGQAWMLVAPDATQETEIKARSLGALMVWHEMPKPARLNELAAALHLRKQRAARTRHRSETTEAVARP
jgi:DNA-binding response OmpR family regulator